MQQLIKQLREAEKEMTEAPWSIGRLQDLRYAVFYETGAKGVFRPISEQRDIEPIILMRNNLTTLLDYVEALQKENEVLKEAYEIRKND